MEMDICKELRTSKRERASDQALCNMRPELKTVVVVVVKLAFLECVESIERLCYQALRLQFLLAGALYTGG